MQLPDLSCLPANLRVREYQPADLEACLGIYRSNLEEFLPDAVELFVDHLSGPFSWYLVVESGETVLACGGIDLLADADGAGLAFGMVRRNWHRRGIGSLLMLSRLALLDNEHDPAYVGLETTPAMEPFYQRFGFTRLSLPEAQYAGGSYYVNMGLWLSMTERDEIRQHLAALPIAFDVPFPEDGDFA